MTTTYVVATTEAPTIVCPSWCEVSTETHLAELEGWEGRVIHWSSHRELCDDFTVALASTATPAGDETDEGLTVHIYKTPDPVPLEDAQRAVVALAELLREARP